MAELVKVYEDYDSVENDLGCYVARNQEAVKRVTPRKNNLWQEIKERVIPRKNSLLDSKIELSHLVELRALERNDSLGYFLNDDILSFTFGAGDGSDIVPHESIDQLALKAKERIKYQKERYEREIRCEVTILPIFYTIGLEERLTEINGVLDQNWLQISSMFLSRANLRNVLVRNNIILSVPVKDGLYQELERGLTEEERKSFERIYNQI
ncbi:MAG: hypothetical protein KKA62_01365 [Nanoarchaeota archaeon]|nr:hypothetical protein [Nanoarchaeota archaeon]MBU1976582.1 hypothetical protein [Nanoarchaeota archaeon]